MQKQQIITGLWKFHERVSEEQLISVAKSLIQDPSYMQVYIRKASKDQNGIGFMYDCSHSENYKKDYDIFFDENSDKLKREFGNDLVGWDISSSTIIIK